MLPVFPACTGPERKSTDPIVAPPRTTTENADMNARLTGLAMFPPDDAVRLAAVERKNDSVGLRLNYKWDDDAALNIFQRSDQFPFAMRDIPAVWWFTGFHPDYHQTTDTVEKINFAKMEKILRLAYLTGEQFANASAPPRFVARPPAGGSR